MFRHLVMAVMIATALSSPALAESYHPKVPRPHVYLGGHLVPAILEAQRVGGYLFQIGSLGPRELIAMGPLTVLSDDNRMAAISVTALALDSNWRGPTDDSRREALSSLLPLMPKGAEPVRAVGGEHRLYSDESQGWIYDVPVKGGKLVRVLFLTNPKGRLVQRILLLNEKGIALLAEGHPFIAEMLD